MNPIPLNPNEPYGSWPYIVVDGDKYRINGEKCQNDFEISTITF